MKSFHLRRDESWIAPLTMDRVFALHENQSYNTVTRLNIIPTLATEFHWLLVQFNVIPDPIFSEWSAAGFNGLKLQFLTDISYDSEVRKTYGPQNIVC